MKKFLENLANMVKVKTLVTAAVVSVFSFLAVKGRIDADSVMLIVSMVISFYFGTQSNR